MAENEALKTGASVALCMIVRNEQENLARCLLSIQPLAAEINVADTGSTDGTAAVAESFGAAVRSIEWNNDFSSARNISLQMAHADWILILDADEVLSPEAIPLIQAAMKTAEVTGYTLPTRNYTDDENCAGFVPNDAVFGPAAEFGGWVESRKVRLFRNVPEIRFEGRLHELVEPSIRRIGGRIEFLDAPVHHFGYVGSPQTLRPKLERMKAIAEIKCQESRKDYKALYELGVIQARLEELDQALVSFRKAIDLKADFALAHYDLAVVLSRNGNLVEAVKEFGAAAELDPAGFDAPYNLAVSLQRLSRWAESEAVYLRLLRRYPSDKRLWNNVGAVYASMGRFAEARDAFQKALQLDPGDAAAKQNLSVLERAPARPLKESCALTLNMIVRDEERNLKEALAPIAALFDEIVIVDTGSADATAEIAASFGAKVIRHPWNNNFGEARNAALKHSAGKWIFWMDADDRIDCAAVGTLRKFIARGIPCGVLFPLESRIGQSGASVINYTVRLFPNRPGLLWQGAVHEQIAQSLLAARLELVNCPDFTIRHLGYEKDEYVLQKNLRNLKLLAGELAARPEDPYVLFALAQAFLLCGQIQAAARWLHELWRLREKVDMQAWQEVFWMAAIVLSDCAAASRECQQAEDWLNRAIELAPGNWLAYFLLGERKLNAQDWEQASFLLHRAHELGVAPTILPLHIEDLGGKLRRYLSILNERVAAASSEKTKIA